MKVGLFFGSFNPIHIGHLAIANYLLEFTNLNELWFVVSPHNPLKFKHTLLADYHRHELVRRAIDDYPQMKVSNIEFKMPKPSYTIDTLTYLEEKYPNKNFVLIIGSDNIGSFHKWKNFQVLLSNYSIIVYPRINSADKSKIKFNEQIEPYKNAFKFVDAPIIELSSAMIRNAIKEGKNVQFFLYEPVFQYLTEMNFYKK